MRKTYFFKFVILVCIVTLFTFTQPIYAMSASSSDIYDRNRCKCMARRN